MLDKVTVKIPATTANIGAGFDTFGMAFAFYSAVTVRRVGGFDGIKITNRGEITNSVQDPNRNLVANCAKKLWNQVGYDYNGVELILQNDIPISRGLGSSAAAIVGGFVAANEMTGRPFDNKQLLEMSVDVEGHPDNVAPALLGGFVSSCRRNGETVVFKAVPPADLKAVVAIPDFHLSTKMAREAMPKQVSVQDAVYNIQCASLLVGAMLSGNYELFSKAVDDRLHQPYRFPLIKGADEVLEAARKAGALASALSGAGPTLIAFTDGDGKAIQSAMQKAWQKADVKCRALILEQDNEGVKIEK